ncbi:helix-turn-helix domain-containing protein [Pseudoalteromonas phenolica]|uniref:helix-turn-helix domain-containing protein n=1 Tax=Pseudoalteromonas phenolica TaxID=161398 RepID=UPI00110A3130|nr:helix-turn-helix domain-containing protein [Pseudoalteromonas phenolica]TMO54112.1 DNA-binding protein [Pseudoalteromonas phenolica]
MKPSEIKDAIDEKGYTLSMVAESLGVNLATVSGVIHGHSKSLRIANAICKIIEKSLQEVFPKTPTYIKPSYISGDARKAKVAELQQLLAS